MRKYPVAWCYILAFGISWFGMISIVLGSRGITPFDSPYLQFLSIFYAIGPALVAANLNQYFCRTFMFQALFSAIS
jgi:uncharacterized protein